MPFCPSCGAEFRAGFTECNTCQVPLVASLEAAEEAPGRAADFEDDTLRLLSSFGDEAQAAFVRRLLDDAGVPSVLQGGHAANVKGCEPYRVLVDEDYFEAAQETIEIYRSPALVTGQIEGNLSRLRDELQRLERGREDLTPQFQAVEESLERLQADLSALNRELEESK
jgi:hypothetical protein